MKKRVLIVSGLPYSKTNRGIDVMTSYFIEKEYQVEHLVFPVNKLKKDIIPQNRKESNFKQIIPKKTYYAYLGLMGRIFPQFLLKLIVKQNQKLVKEIKFSEFDLIVLESGKPLFLLDKISEKIPIILRISDVIEMSFGAKNKYFQELERKGIERAKLTLVVNEKSKEVYKSKNVVVWRNGYEKDEKENTNEKILNESKKIVYMGLAEIDYNLIEYLAERNQELDFYIVGPFKDKLKRKNVYFTGYLTKELYIQLLEGASCFLLPYSKRNIKRAYLADFTSKMYVAMDKNIPILSIKYGGIDKDIEEFKLYTFETFNEAGKKLEKIINLEKKAKTKEVKYFLEGLTVEKRKEELEKILIENNLI